MDDLLEIGTSTSYLHSIYAESGDYERAYDYHLIYKETSDKIRNEKNTEEMTELAMQHQFDKEKALIAAENAKQVAFQRLGLLATLGGLLLVSILAYYIRKGKKRSDELLHNILPEEVALELKQKGEVLARKIDAVTVLFTDFSDFTSTSQKLSPEELVNDLNIIFSEFDRIIESHGVEKIKTIGDAYMAAGGLPVVNTTHQIDVINAALEIRDYLNLFNAQKVKRGLPYFEVRIGMHTGPVVAGIVGVKKFAYDIWGDTVNTANRMEFSGEIGKINISESTYNLVKNNTNFKFSFRGMIKAKGKGEMKMYYIERA
jgi:class 3 adenylate cyclase